MPLRLAEITARTPVGRVGPDNWVDGRERIFIGSSTFDIIKRDMRRYIQGEIYGRSHLVAGHRGAGKTALVLRAVEDLELEILTGQTANQRPLLVKLHGPSLFSGDLPAATGPAAARSQGASGEKLRAALAQMTVALYRAVARDVAKSFRLHVRRGAAASDHKFKLLELAAVLTLELDNGSTAGALRGFWQKLDRVGPGILWPSDWSSAPPDQGMREIVAIATASQAFQVCIGAIDTKTVSTTSNVASQGVKSGFTLDAGPALNRLAGLLGGAALGTGLALGGVAAPAAAVSGLAAGLIGAASFSASAARARDRSQSSSYEFIRDTSITTLDRDLPVVIERLRHAGLTPVFLVDELDKLDDTLGGGKAVRPDRLTELIDRLKNLTTDYGFFCFLTNRDYYESLRAKSRKAAYPREHTYFSDLQFVLCAAPQQLRYVLHAVSCTVDGTDRDAPTHWMTLAFAVRLRARLNVIALMRELNRHFDDAGLLRPEFHALATRPRYRLAAAIQLAIDVTLADPDVQARIEDDPLFGQLAVDALYYLPDRLEAGDATVSLAQPDLAAFLRSRTAGAGDAAAIDQSLLPELEVLVELATGMARSLTDFTALAGSAARYWTSDRKIALLPDRGDASTEIDAVATFANIIPAPTPIAGLVREDTEGSGQFTFLLDRFGGLRQRDAAAVPGAAKGLSPAEPGARIDGLMGAAGALVGDPADPAPRGALAELMLTVPYLREIGVLEPTVPDEAAIRDALLVVTAATSVGGTAAADAMALIERFVESCVQAAPYIAWAGLLTRSVAEIAERLAVLRPDVRLQPYSEEAVRAGVARHVRVFGRQSHDGKVSIADAVFASVLSPLPDNVDPTIVLPRIGDLNAAAVTGWLTNACALPALPIGPEELAANPWHFWREQAQMKLIDWRPGPLGLSISQSLPVPLSQLVFAARGVPPSLLFRRDLLAMSTLEWSDLLLSTSWFSYGDQETPLWAPVAALRALGFGPNVRKSAIMPFKVFSATGEAAHDQQAMEMLAAPRAPGPESEARAYVLYIVDSSGPTVADQPPPNDGRAVFAVRRVDYKRAKTLLDIVDKPTEFQGYVV